MTVRSRDRCSEEPRRRSLSGIVPGMRMRELVARNTRAFEEVREELRLNREERQSFREELAGMHEEMRAEREAARAERELASRKLDIQLESQRAVTRELLVDMREHRERMNRQSDASIDALADLAAEIRRWSGGEPPAPA